MTLQEYFNQADPKRDVKVVLDATEYIKYPTTKKGPANYWTVVEIPQIAEKFGLPGIYIQLNDLKQLFTQNLKIKGELKASVFHIPETDIDNVEVRQYVEFRNAKVDWCIRWVEENVPNDLLDEKELIEKFNNQFALFLRSNRGKYNLTDEDIEYRLKS